MARDLDTLKEVLWTQFEKAVKRQPSYDIHDSDYSNSSYPGNDAIEGRKSIALLAGSIISLEAEQREQQAANGDSIRLPGKTAGALKRG